jgi:hypothetical protein
VSTEITLLGLSLATTTVFNFAGLIGGLFLAIYDLITRQKLPDDQKIDLNWEFF